MGFISFTFMLFLAVVLAGYYCLPWKIGRWFLILSSYVFYGALQPAYCVLPFLSTLIDFVAGEKIANSSIQSRRKTWLVLSIIANLALLGAFKYIDFAIWNINFLTALMGVDSIPYQEWVLPIGISFYTFQSMSYTLDIYRRRQNPEKNFGNFCLYVIFFPQLVAGPIERAGKLIPQLASKHRVRLENLEQGFQRVLWGLVKKLVFADRLALMVNPVYANPSAASAAELVVATLCFFFQLYLDFSAYCDIAIGVARMMGIRLSENFNYPYMATSASKFWSRWHMTLTSWFRDYVYNSLGGTRINHPYKSLLSVVLVMGLVGLWHGASWNFVVFGLLGGAALVLQFSWRFLTRRLKSGNSQSARWLDRVIESPVVGNILTMTMVFILLVFFRASDLGSAMTVLSGIIHGSWDLSFSFVPQYVTLLFVWGLHFYRGRGLHRRHSAMSAPVRGAFWSFLLLVLLYGTVETGEQFIYFQF